MIYYIKINTNWISLFLIFTIVCEVKINTNFALKCIARSPKWRWQDHKRKSLQWSDHCMFPLLTDFWKGPLWRDSVTHFLLERPFKWRPLPEVPFKGTKKPFGIRPMSNKAVFVSGALFCVQRYRGNLELSCSNSASRWERIAHWVWNFRLKCSHVEK